MNEEERKEKILNMLRTKVLEELEELLGMKVKTLIIEKDKISIYTEKGEIPLKEAQNDFNEKLDKSDKEFSIEKNGVGENEEETG